MRMQYCRRVILAALGIFLLGGITGARSAAADRPVLIIADLSGSSQERLGYFNSPERNAVIRTNRADAMKEILTQFAQGLPADYCPIGLFEMRYLSGDKNCYVPIIPVAAYQSGDLQARVKADLITETPVFNRRTALADSLRQLDENILKPLEGRAVILLISDGGENIRSRGKDEDEKQNIQSDDPVRGPFSEVRRLKLEYGDKLFFHAIGLECGDPADEKKQGQEGINLLQKMTAAAGGRYLSGRELLQNRQAIADLYPLLCGNVEFQPQLRD